MPSSAGCGSTLPPSPTDGGQSELSWPIGETPAGAETAHDCSRPVPWVPAAGKHDTVPLFTPIDRARRPRDLGALHTVHHHHRRPRLTTPNSSHSPGEGWDDPDPTASLSARAWDETDRARVLAERKAAAARFAGIEASLDEAEAYAEAILQRFEAANNGNLAGQHW